MGRKGEVLVAIIHDKLDFDTLRTQQWYRIPVSSQKKWLKDRWPPEIIAFYQTKKFDAEAYAVHYYAEVIDIRQRYRWQLLERNPQHPHDHWLYHQLLLGPLKRLPEPIVSRRWRRIVFIPSTFELFAAAREINDLYDESSLENCLWGELKRHQILAERQELVKVKVPAESDPTGKMECRDYFLDFGIYCKNGKIDVETDGSYWHDNPERAQIDRPRDNALVTAGWTILRFDDHDIRERMADYCLPSIEKNIEKCGRLDDGSLMGRGVSLKNPGVYQMGLFDPPPEKS